MKKIAYLIPGLGESHVKQKGWSKVANLFESNGIKSVHITIDWDKNNPSCFSDYTKEFLEQFKKPKNTEVYILGFSFGAMIAFLTATKTKPTALILCSLSPFFEEDIAHFKPQWLTWWRKNFVDSDYSFEKIAPKITAKTYLIVEDVDAKEIMHRARAAKRKLPNATLVIAKGAKHRIIQKEYMTALERVVKKLQ
jgi:pimeloyl-ACP methyl ester carboxylesterase